MLARNTQIALLALVAGSIVSTEVLLTRLLSVATYYGLAFVVLSLAMKPSGVLLFLGTGEWDASASHAYDQARPRAHLLRAWRSCRAAPRALVQPDVMVRMVNDR